MQLILWDIDGTLIRTLGAGMRALKRAAVSHFGDSFTFDGVEAAGRLDPLIVAAAAKRNGHELTDDDHRNIHDHYLQYLPDELSRPNPTPPCALPGVIDLLQKMRKHPDITLGLLTGNFTATGKVKLTHCGIDPNWFSIHAFADTNGQHAADRASLVPLAMKTYEQQRGSPIDPNRVVLIGDTPHDIAAARANHCRVVCVASGPFSRDQLASHHPDLLLDDFTDPAPFWDWL